MRARPTPAQLLGVVQRNVRRLVGKTPFYVAEVSRETELGFFCVGLCLYRVGHNVHEILSYRLFFIHSSPLPLLQRHRRRRRLLGRRLIDLSQLLLHSLLLLLHLRLELQQLAFEGAEDENGADHE